jgi:hypothetical protein
MLDDLNTTDSVMMKEARIIIGGKHVACEPE